MKNDRFLTLLFFIILANFYLFSQDSIPVTIHSDLFPDGAGVDEPLYLKITDTLTNFIWYDSLATVTVADGFRDTVYLDSGIYKCEVGMGADVSMPVITLNNGYVVPWGYPEYEYYLFTVPGGALTTSANISVTSCDYYTSPSSKYTWSSSGVYTDTLLNSIGYDSIVTIDLTIISLDNSVILTDGIMSAVESEATYQWFTCNANNIISGASNQIYTPIVSGLYMVRITKNNCEVVSPCYSVIVSNTDVSRLESSISVYPNPVNEYLIIEFIENYRKIDIEVIDIYGRSMLFSHFSNQNQVRLDLQNFNSGFYNIKVIADKEYVLLKVLKE